MHHTLTIDDGFKMNDKPGSTAVIAPPVLHEYEVICESGLFKKGKQYHKGEKILLPEKTAAAFVAAGDIKKL
jgi:hypothetical protein